MAYSTIYKHVYAPAVSYCNKYIYTYMPLLAAAFTDAAAAPQDYQLLQLIQLPR